MILSDLDNIVYNKFANGEITLTEYIKYQNRDKMINYEEKYKQALERAKDMLSYKEVRQEDMEYLFPELAESEDERIRKKLICFVKNWKKYNPNSPFDDYAVYTSGSDECDKILAWLEKQGEKHPCIGCTNDKGCVTCENGNLKEIKIEPKKLDADKVIEWMKTHGNLWPRVTIKINEVIEKFKKDFDL